MPEYYSRRDTIAILTALGLGGKVSTGSAAAQTHNEDEEGGPTLNRFATTVRAAEITGMFLTANGRFFFNIQHPGSSNEEPYDDGTVGTVTGLALKDLPNDFASVPVPEGEGLETVHTAAGEYQALANGRDPTDNGNELGVPYTPDGERLAWAQVPDFNGFVPADNPDEGYLFTNWETVPGMVSRLHLRMEGRSDDDQNQNGSWEVLGSQNVDFRAVEGTWNNCFGTVSPWGTPLTSEEYEPDASNWFRNGGSGADKMSDYLGRFANAYRYGHIVEITDPTGHPTPVKHHAMGRFSHENSVVMPDGKTAYMSDDGTGTVFFKFVADEPGDLSAGTLYAAQATQDDSTDVAAAGFDLKWIELAHGTDDQIEEWIADYDGQEQGPNADYITDNEIEAWANGNASDDRAAFLESRKAAAAVGATDEFRKMEGVNIQRGAMPGDYLYMAMSSTNLTMSDGEGDIALQGDGWGAIYRMELDESYNVSRMEPVVVGGPDANICGGCPYDARPDSASSVCADCAFNPTADENENAEATGNETVDTDGNETKGVNGTVRRVNGTVRRGMEKMGEAFASQSFDPETTIASPDNIVVMSDGRVVIGEDSSNQGHDPPNMIWVYDPGEGERGPSDGPDTLATIQAPTEATIGERIGFEVKDTSGSDRWIESLEWTFDDGATGSGWYNAHRYDSADTYRVTLTATDNTGASTVDYHEVTISDLSSSLAKIQPSTEEAGVGERVEFKVKDSSGSDRWIKSLEWTFGDETTGSGWYNAHSYDSAGTYTVTLTVTDNTGASSTHSVTIKVS